MGEDQVTNSIVTFIVIPLILIIGLYLLACAIAPLVDLNNLTFRIMFTLAGGIPSLLFYLKSEINSKSFIEKLEKLTEK